MHACSQLLSPLVDGRVNNVLLQTVPDVSEAQLQVIDTVHMIFIHSVLHNTPDFIFHYIQVWTVWWPEIGVTCCSCLMVSLHDEMEHCVVERQVRITCNMLDRWQHLLRE